ncbi:hypothetical protein LEP1GSC170_2737 [Leptospira interrogans serovar Bataviae str. HAI135]|uniref:Uncharacterized protein n=1 Tax=Leptospira noguchii serovar Autumnalis str. ZUN142 TaxID=1085540 RepID=M6UD07_9LEPT|nr:hypothetical protein LEP1GSC170_2737 [Leptospira interrogans serovar Bataviae str. HAI135]EMO42440.1 hypothetical protein LEP1GSC186_1622 [Leptospira noguchii serovar Autumnalis str. ZUN142]
MCFAEFKRDPRNSANASLRIGIQESVLLSSILILKSYSTCGVGYAKGAVADIKSDIKKVWKTRAERYSK